MKIGDRFVHKSGGVDWRVLEVAKADGMMMVKATIMNHDRDGTWFTIDSIRENYRVFSTPIGTKRKRESQEKYPVGTLLLGDYDHNYYRVAEINRDNDGKPYSLICLSDHKVPTLWHSESFVISSWTIVSHAFYVRDGVLRVEPALTGDEDDPLGLSIEKWRVIVEAMEQGEKVHGDGGPITCALCKAYNMNTECSSCPIRKYIHTHGCCNTPYVWWGKSRSLAAAKAELALLQEIRDGV